MQKSQAKKIFQKCRGKSKGKVDAGTDGSNEKIPATHLRRGSLDSSGRLVCQQKRL